MSQKYQFNALAITFGLIGFDIVTKKLSFDIQSMPLCLTIAAYLMKVLVTRQLQ